MALNIPYQLSLKILNALKTPEAKDAFLKQLTLAQEGQGLSSKTIVTADHTVAESERKEIIAIDTTSGAITLTMPSPVDGKEIIVKHIGGDLNTHGLTTANLAVGGGGYDNYVIKVTPQPGFEGSFPRYPDAFLISTIDSNSYYSGHTERIVKPSQNEIWLKIPATSGLSQGEFINFNNKVIFWFDIDDNGTMATDSNWNWNTNNNYHPVVRVPVATGNTALQNCQALLTALAADDNYNTITSEGAVRPLAFALYGFNNSEYTPASNSIKIGPIVDTLTPGTNIGSFRGSSASPTSGPFTWSFDSDTNEITLNFPNASDIQQGDFFTFPMNGSQIVVTFPKDFNYSGTVDVESPFYSASQVNANLLQVDVMSEMTGSDLAQCAHWTSFLTSFNSDNYSTTPEPTLADHATDGSSGGGVSADATAITSNGQAKRYIAYNGGWWEI